MNNSEALQRECPEGPKRQRALTVPVPASPLCLFFNRKFKSMSEFFNEPSKGAEKCQVGFSKALLDN